MELGVLGNLRWYRCQSCGIDHFATDKNLEIVCPACGSEDK